MSVEIFTSILNQLLPEPHAGLLNGILFGIKADIPKDFMDALITTGTLHIVALSGMNITILETIIAKTLGNFLNIRLSSMLTIFLIIGFILFVGPSPSIIRAGIMGTIALVATIFGKQTWGIYIFGITIAIMLGIHPSWIGDLSFQLSALATLGIILFGPKKEKNIFIDTLHVTLAAQVFTIPLILFTFHRISLISPLTNVLIGWVIPPLTVIGFVLAIAGWIFFPLAKIIAPVAWVFLQYLITCIQITAVIPFASLK